MKLGKNSNKFFFPPVFPQDWSQLKHLLFSHFSLDLNVCATTVYPHMYSLYLHIDCMFVPFKWLSFPHMKNQVFYSSAVSDQLGSLPWQKVLAKHERYWRWNARSLTFTMPIFLHFKLDPFSKNETFLLLIFFARFLPYLRYQLQQKMFFPLVMIFVNSKTQDIAFSETVGLCRMLLFFIFLPLSLTLMCYELYVNEIKVFSRW